MLLFAFPGYEPMAAALLLQPGIRPGRFTIGRFANRELHAAVAAEVAGQCCAILGSIAPPDEALLSFLLLSHTLKKAGAAKLIAVLPYLGYARQDRPEAGKSLGAAWVGQLLQAAEIDQVVCVDVHSPYVAPLFPMPLLSLSPAELFAQEIARLGLLEAGLVAPDEGALSRCAVVRQAAGMKAPVAYLEKVRTSDGIKHLALHGETRPQAVVIDDILDTGETLVSCCEALQRAGTREIVVMVTHAQFTGDRWQRLWSLGVKQIHCTDTTGCLASRLSERILELSVVPLLQAYLQTQVP